MSGQSGCERCNDTGVISCPSVMGEDRLDPCYCCDKGRDRRARDKARMSRRLAHVGCENCELEVTVPVTQDNCPMCGAPLWEDDGGTR
jgi:ribosomal protein S27E